MTVSYVNIPEGRQFRIADIGQKDKEVFVDRLTRESTPKPEKQDPVKDRIRLEKILAIVRDTILMITATTISVVQLAVTTIPYGMIISPVLGLVRAINSLTNTIREFQRVSKDEKFILQSELPEELKTLCLGKLHQEDVNAWWNLIQNIGSLTVSVVRVAVTAAAVAAFVTPGSGFGLAALTGVGIGWAIVANTVKFALQAYKNPNRTWETLKGNGLKHFWLDKIVSSFQEYRLNSLRKELMEKYNDSSVTVLDLKDHEEYELRTQAVKETKERIKQINTIYVEAGRKDAERSRTEEDRKIETHITNFTMDKYNAMNASEQAAFRFVFGADKTKIENRKDNYLRKKLERLFSASRDQGTIGIIREARHWHNTTVLAEPARLLVHPEDESHPYPKIA